MNIAGFIPNLDIGGGSVLNTPKQASQNSGAFWSALSALSTGYTAVRNRLSDAEIAVLAARYDPGHMTGEEYAAFLDDLESMGAITAEDHEEMSGYGMTMTLSGYDGVNGNLLRLLKSLQAANIPEEGERLSILSELAGRVAGQRQTWETAEESAAEAGPRSVLEQINDAGGGFWLDLRRTIIENAREKREQAEAEEKIELLSLMLDNLTGRNDPRVSAAVGLRLGVNADQSVIQSGALPPELQTYLLTLGSKTAFELTEEKDENDKVEEIGDASAEKLFMGSEMRQDLMEEDLAELAKQYDPNNMSREEYDRFLEDLVKLGAASEEAIRWFGYHGLTAVSADKLSVFFVSDAPGAPALQRSPVDGNIEEWIQNRILWKPGITRESARRMGLSQEYDRVMEEERTLARIAQVLADVKRQRYPSVSL